MASVTKTTPATTTSNTGAWDVDVAHSAAEFSVRHMMIATVKGTIPVLKGEVVYDDARPEATRIEATLDLAGINTGAKDRDNHLRSADFFDVATHPAMTFRSTRVERDGDDFRIEGELTIRGTTRPVVLEAQLEGFGIDPWGKRRAGLTATTTLDRRDWSLTWNVALEAGGVLVGDKVKVSLNLQLVQRAE